MITTFTIESFKSLERVKVNLGQVNVFIGANGSGKTNLLEAMGVLSAAANGKVDDPSLQQRGIRPGLPSLYKTTFRQSPESPRRRSPHIFFGASNTRAQYEVSLHNPLKNPLPAWRYQTESLDRDGKTIVGRGPHMRERPHPEQGLAALRAVELADADPARQLLQQLQQYAIFSPSTAVLRGASDPQSRAPVGLSGGKLPEALDGLIGHGGKSDHAKRVRNDALGLIGWAKDYGSAPASSIPLSPAAAASAYVVRFTDRYMAEGRNVLSGSDASEGALYILFMAVLAAHPYSPALCAVDNADHGLNPRLARALMQKVCEWYITAPVQRQILITTHNPLVLDGLLLQNDMVRLFTVSRTDTGRTIVQRVEMSEGLQRKAKDGWTLSRLWVMGHLGGIGDV